MEFEFGLEFVEETHGDVGGWESQLQASRMYCSLVVQMWRAVCSILLRHCCGFVQAVALSLESLKDRECSWAEMVGLGRSFFGYDTGNQNPRSLRQSSYLSLVEEFLKPPEETLVILTGKYFK